MIGIFDSGSGGLSVLKEIVKALPLADIVYYSDNANCPYGDKPISIVRDRADSITKELVAEGADIIVIACNTATSAAVAWLREKYSTPRTPENKRIVLEMTMGRHDHIRFIGMEPAVKPAALDTRSGVIGVLATAGTLKGSKYLSIKDKYDRNVKVVEHVGKGFVELVESCELSGPHVESVVSASLSPLLEAGADTVVLGCTHYPFLLPVMRKIAGPQVRFIDPAPAVAARLKNVMAEENISEEDGNYTLKDNEHQVLGMINGYPTLGMDNGRQSSSSIVGYRASDKVLLRSSGDPASMIRLYDYAVAQSQDR